jgi:hypothetical protein
MSKSKLSSLTIGVVIIGISLIVFVAKDVFKKPQTALILPTVSPSAASQKPVVVATPISKPLSQTKTFPHELLPGFNITIPSSWVISSVKQFGGKDTIGFSSNYFPSLPVENAMAFRIFKNGTFFDLIFDLIFDDSGSNCSNSVEATDIGGGWFAVSDDQKYIYTKNVEFNSKNIYESNSKTYRTCIVGSGILTSIKPTNKVAPYGGAIILEHIKVYGPTNQDILNEINTIVRSIVL